MFYVQWRLGDNQREREEYGKQRELYATSTKRRILSRDSRNEAGWNYDQIEDEKKIIFLKSSSLRNQDCEIILVITYHYYSYYSYFYSPLSLKILWIHYQLDTRRFCHWNITIYLQDLITVLVDCGRIAKYVSLLWQQRKIQLS